MTDKPTNRNVNDIILERIRASFGELMTDDEWRDVVTSEVTRFKMPVKDRYGGAPAVSPLAAMVSKQLEEAMLAKIKSILADRYYSVEIDKAGHQIVGDMIKKLVEEHMATGFKMLAESIAGRMVGGLATHVEARLNELRR